MRTEYELTVLVGQPILVVLNYKEQHLLLYLHFCTSGKWSKMGSNSSIIDNTGNQ